MLFNRNSLGMEAPVAGRMLLLGSCPANHWPKD